MAVDDSDFKQKIEDQTEKRRLQDATDHQNEVAGRSAGRMYHFHPSEKPGEHLHPDKHTLDHTTLHILLENPEYAELYNNTLDLLALAEAATEKALVQAEQDLADAQDILDNMHDNANKLPDGTAVFRDKDGNVWSEDGELVDPADAAGIVWKDNAPSYEDYLNQKQAVTDTQQRIDALRLYLVDTLGGARDRMSNPDNPPSKDDLDQMQQDIIDNAPPIIHDQLTHEAVVDHSQSSDASPMNVDVPKL